MSTGSHQQLELSKFLYCRPLGQGIEAVRPSPNNTSWFMTASTTKPILYMLQYMMLWLEVTNNVLTENDHNTKPMDC